MLISKVNFIGIQLYYRERLSEKKIDVSSDSTPCDNIGLFVISEYPRLEFNYISIYQKKEWNKIAFQTISLALLNLIVSKKIEVIEVKDVKHYFFKFFRFDITDYYFKVVDNENVEDFLSNVILDAIRLIEKRKPIKKDTHSVIHLLLDEYLGKNEEHNRPEKKFIIRNIKVYEQTYDWLKLTKEKKAFGLYSNYKLEVKEIYIPKLKMQHKDLKLLESNLLKSNTTYASFIDRLRDILYRDFKLREPSDSADVD